MEFLATIDRLKGEEASVRKLFNETDGRGVRHMGNKTPDYMAKLSEAATLVADVFEGKRHPRYLVEAMTTSDFPILFGDILDRQMLAEYVETPSNWRQFIKTRRARDFRPVEYRYRPNGEAAEGRLEAVREQEEYPEVGLDDISKVSYSIGKFGRRMPLSWETLINDDIDYFASIPGKFGKAARRTESREALGLFVDADGPISPFFSNGNGNLLDAPLTVAGLQEAIAVFANLTDDQGEPIYVEAAILVVPPALEITAQNILNATEIRMGSATVGQGDLGTAGDTTIITGNWLKNRVRVVVEPYLPVIDQSGAAATTWYMFADPNSGRPAGEMAFLIGHEQPEVFIKEPNARRVGGGIANPLDGDFDTDSIEYKVRHVMGGSRIEPKAAVASTGDGS